MLNEIQQNKFTARAKEVAQKLLKELNIEKITDDTICDLQEELDLKVSSLVTMQECENKKIDEELLEIYDLLVDIVLDNEEDTDFLNQLFFN